MKLLDSVIKSAKPRDSIYSLPDGGGLALYVQPGGSKLWRYRYRFHGKANMLSLGEYPAISLAQARQEHACLRELLAQGVDPSQHRQEQKQIAAIAAANSFESVARLWWKQWGASKSERHAAYTLKRLEVDIFPLLGARPINAINAPSLVAVAKKIQSRGSIETARRMFTTLGQIFRYAVANGMCERNPAADVKPNDFLQPGQKTHFARLDEKGLSGLLRKIDEYDGQPLTRMALQLTALTFVRSAELIGARWEEIDLTKKAWRIPAERMKMKTPHVVPLSRQAIAVLQELHAISGGDVLIFGGAQGNVRYGDFLRKALYQMGFYKKMTIHGFRGVASTILHEQGYPHEHIELQLAHAKRDQVSASYNHALYLEPRAKMMQQWADYLDELKKS